MVQNNGHSGCRYKGRNGYNDQFCFTPHSARAREKSASVCFGHHGPRSRAFLFQIGLFRVNIDQSTRASQGMPD